MVQLIVRIPFRAEILSISLLSPDTKGPIKVYASFIEVRRDNLPKHAFQEMPLAYPKVRENLQTDAKEVMFNFGGKPNEENNTALLKCADAFIHYVRLHVSMLQKVVDSDEWYAGREIIKGVSDECLR